MAQSDARWQAREKVRARSKSLFGNKDRLEIAVEIARSRDGYVNATDLSAATGLLQSRVRNQLLALVDAELLEEVPETGDGRRRWFRRKESPFWQGCLELIEDWGA